MGNARAGYGRGMGDAHPQNGNLPKFVHTSGRNCVMKAKFQSFHMRKNRNDGLILYKYDE